MGEAWDRARPTRTIALPAASYPEMMLWALPPEVQARIEEEQHWLDSQGKPDLARRIATGTWREFLSRYPESRRLHRRVSELSARIEHQSRSCLAQESYEEARKEAHRAQCNCSYWHGVFGGFYLPHLREAVHAHMLRAESMADQLRGDAPGWTLESADEEEVRLKSSRVLVGVSKRTGAIVEIVERGRPFDLAGVIARRREAYHVRVEEARIEGRGERGKAETIHGAISVKEAGLERLLHYDERPRHASQEWLRSAMEIASAGGLNASIGTGPVGLSFEVVSGGSAAPLVALQSEKGARASVRKEIAPGPDSNEFEVRFTGVPADTWLVSEWNLSLLTPDAPGRRLTVEGATSEAHAPGSSGKAESVRSIRLEDSEYLHVALTLRFEPAARMEWYPVETVSLSESGAERVYQGTALVFGFPGGSAPIRIRARVEGTGDAL